jgi:hypothetical protein
MTFFAVYVVYNAYTHLGVGLKLHKESKKLFVYGMKVHKRVIKQGIEKEDTRSDLTKAKDKIRRYCKSNSWRSQRI